MSWNQDRDVADWTGPYRRYDLFKEVAICAVVSLVLALVLAVVFSSPDERPVTLKSWSNAAPVGFAVTAAAELGGTSPTATYGPPYTNTPGAGQKLGPLSLEGISGVTLPIDTADDFVLGPLLTLPDRPGLRAAIGRYRAASATQESAWTATYAKAVSKSSFRAGQIVLPPGPYGPVATIVANLESMARSGALDGALLATPQLYGTDYTKPLLFIADGTYLADQAGSRHLQGTQWGMMNETGNYPGQAWLWLYTMWYQVPPYSSSHNADVLVWGTMMVLTVLLALVPFIPGVRSIPRRTRVYKLIWREHYRSLNHALGAAGDFAGPVGGAGPGTAQPPGGSPPPDL